IFFQIHVCVQTKTITSDLPGHDAILPCASASPSDTTCSIVTWFYNRDPSETLTEVQEGKVERRSARAARMSLDTSCSLVINNITAEDAGQYTCQQGRSHNHDTDLYLSVLTSESHFHINLLKLLGRNSTFGKFFFLWVALCQAHSSYILFSCALFHRTEELCLCSESEASEWPQQDIHLPVC
uniref:Ig-like domain-containing protein n=1 Tax=Dicentrarchus labrax TaxID=13489 RepID=A0A8C4GLU4_DICLA